MLQKVYAFMKGHQGMGKIKQLFKQLDNAAQLKACQDEVQVSLERFKVHLSGVATTKLAEMQQDAETQHEGLLALLAAHPELTNSERSSVTGTTFSLGDSTASLALLPAAPQIFHGRDSELQEVVATLQQDSARIAILGTGGMGKTSLAVAVLHDAEVIKKYANRFFVPCHSTATRSDLVSSVASHVGLTPGPNLARKLVRHLTYGPPALLILDNFETPWEPLSGRVGVEEFLSLLADVPHLALVVTMRGAERPSRVKWTRPFIPPLSPLNDAAALQTFFDIADNSHEEGGVRELLDLTGNLPLAVSLIANIVSYEGCDATLARWQTESTRVVSDGYDKKSSLDISIMLSFSSARMTSEAQQLLSILSLMPDGLSDGELLQSNLPIPKLLSAKMTLIRTSLAYIGRNNRLMALVPIREHVRSTHPPPAAHKSTMRAYFRDSIDLWKQFKTIPSPEIVSNLSANLGNINTILADGLQDEAPDIIPTMESIMVLSGFCRMTNHDTSPLMPLVAERIARFSDKPVYGTYFVDKFFSSRFHPIRDPEGQISLATAFFDRQDGVNKVQWYNALGAYYSSQGNDPRTSIRYREMAVSITDSVEDEDATDKTRTGRLRAQAI
ncbi:P-loop containing nucleoside triphosphate hydrolase protein, partial [Mycena galericulata]